jgi:mono/diheme cytochrome c family protein
MATQSAIVIVSATMGLLVLPVLVLSPPLFEAADSAVQDVPDAAGFSEAAQSGMLSFGLRCAECHGPGGGGTEQGPSLITKTYSADFSDAPAFWTGPGGSIPAHRDFRLRAERYGRLGVNELAMLAAFLEEQRKARFAEDAAD